MSGSDPSRRNHRKKGALNNLLNRLRGKKRQRSSHQHVHDFPGISLPKDYDPLEKKKGSEEDLPEMMETPKPVRDFSAPSPDRIKKKKSIATRFKRRKLKLYETIDLYFKRRSQRREDYQKDKLKRKLRKKHQKEYRKQELGRSLGKKLFNQWGKEDKESKLTFFSINSPFFRSMTYVVNSAMIFMFTYVLVYLFYWLSCMLVASWYGIDSTLYYYDLKFNDHSSLWNRFNILMVTGIPPFLSLFAGLFMLRILAKKGRFSGLHKLFLIWTGFHLVNHFFGAFPSGVVTDEGFGYVAAWMYMNTAVKFFFSLVSLFLMGLIGYFSAELILETSDSVNRIKSENRISFIFTQVALPWLIGTVVLLLLRLPKGFEYPYETLMFFSMVFLVIPPFFNEKVKPKLNLLKIKKRRNIHFGYLVLMLVMISFLRIMLGIGLHFLVEINVSVSLGSGV